MDKKTSHIHNKMRTMLRKNQRYLPCKFIKKWHQEIKGCILSMFGALKLSLSNITSAFLETVQLEILQLVEKSIRELLMVFCMQKKLQTNVSLLLSRTGWWWQKIILWNYLQSKIKNWKREQKGFKIFISVKGRLSSFWFAC